MVLKPEEYDKSCFDGRHLAPIHNIGHTEGNKKVFNLGCARGGV